MVCEKTDGTRVMLVCSEFEGKRVCALVNRAFHMEEINLNVPRETVLDCELIDNLILVYDAVLVKGEDVRRRTLTERLLAAASATKMILRTKKDKYSVKVKKMYPLVDIQKVLEAEYPYETDGLVFTPVEEPVRMGHTRRCSSGSRVKRLLSTLWSDTLASTSTEATPATSQSWTFTSPTATK